MDPRGPRGDLPDDGRQDEHFLRLNERARMLAERALFHNDPDAAKELQRMFSPLILRQRNSVEGHNRSELESVLTETTMRALKTAVDKRVDLPLAYVLKALRNEYIRQCERFRRHRESDQPLSDELHPATQDVTPHLDRAAVLREIVGFRDEAQKGRSKIDVLLAEVVAVCYLRGVDLGEAYDLLGLTPAERKSLGERLSREKRSPGSRLNRLGDDIRRIIGGLHVEETLHQPFDRGPRVDNDSQPKGDDCA